MKILSLEFVKSFLALPDQISRMEKNMATTEELTAGFERFDAALKTETEEIKAIVTGLREAIEEDDSNETDKFLTQLDERTEALGKLSEDVSSITAPPVEEAPATDVVPVVDPSVDPAATPSS